MPLEIVRNDITKVKADAIVNTANPDPVVGAGVDEAVYREAGWDELLSERRKIGRMEPGDAAYTDAFGLDAKYIIHTVGPLWIDGESGEAETVAKCYRNSLGIAEELGLESIAFPLISTGTLGFPKDLALRTAIDEISAFLMRHDMTVYLVVYNKEAFELSGRLFQDVKSYIEESEVITREFDRDLYEGSNSRKLRNHQVFEPKKILADRSIGAPLPDEALEESIDDESLSEEAPLFDRMMIPSSGAGAEADEESIEELIKNRKETFQQHLFRLIDRKDADDVEVYKKANIDRKLFSKIKSNVNYNPTKKTALAFAIALELNLDETVDLLGRAGLALSPSSISDTIIRYCIERELYDIFEINCILFDYGQPTLGA